MTYHVRHASEWIIRLGDGTDVSHEKVKEALENLWQFTDELFEMDEVDQALIKSGIACDISMLRAEWDQMVNEVLAKAKLERPLGGYQSKGGFNGAHTEHLGHLLSEMQYLPRAYPDAIW